MDIMICSKCMGPMQSVERHGIVIERCSRCGGVHLDKGELEQLIEAENVYLARQRTRWSHGHPDADDYADTYHGRKRKKRKKKLEGFLEELFDF